MEFRVGGGSLDAAALRLGSVGSRLDEQISWLDSMVSALVEQSWTGTASDEFAVAYLEWLQAARASAEGLRMLARGLTDAGASYDEAEDAIRASFVGADGDV